LLAVYAGCIAFFFSKSLRSPEELPFALPRSGVPVEGRVAEYPAEGRGGTRFALDGVKICGVPCKAGLMVYAPDPGGASYGDRVSFLADLETPPGAAVPGGLDWAEYLAQRGIAAEARARDLEVTRRANPLILLARGFRYGALAAFEKGLKPEPASVLAGVVLGEKKSVPQELKTAFQDSGAMHLLVASGSNVGFVVAVVYFFCARLRVKRRYAGLAALALSGLYVAAAGMDPPLVRAYLMFSAALAAWLLRRETGAFHALTAACLLILLYSPRALFDAGFQMSFLAAYGLVVGMALWGRYFPRKGPAAGAAGLFFVSFFAQLCLYPLLAFYFHKISLVSLASNMLLVPGSGVAMALGFMMALSVKIAPLFKLLAAACGLFMQCFLWTVRFFAGLPFSSVRVPAPSPLFTAGAFAAALAVLHAPLLGPKSPRFYSALGLGLLLMAAGPLRRASAGGGRCGALLFGDGHTHCALVTDGGGRLFLVNPGVNGRKLADAVLARGGASLEAVMLTSAEKKNYSALGELAGRVKVKNVLIPYGPRPPGFEALLAALRKQGVMVNLLWPGETAAGALCGWDGYGPGYTGADRFSWTVGDITVSRGGEYAQQVSAGGPPGSAEAAKGAIVALGGN
jgi:competence protein ComEC